MPVIPDVAIGAIMAAVIAGAISLAGLIISKEQKTSEFRQAWIDALRAEIALYLTQINAVSDAISVEYKDHATKVAALGSLYRDLNRSNFGISLRLNKNKEPHKKIIACMAKLRNLASSEQDFRPDLVRPIEADLLNHSQELLKLEWKRVKKGEVTFVCAKWLAATLILAGTAYIVFFLASHALNNKRDGTSPPAIKIDGQRSTLPPPDLKSAQPSKTEPRTSEPTKLPHGR